MANKKVVIVGIHPLGSEVYVGSQRMAIELSKLGVKVCYLSSPISPFHFLLLGNKKVREKITSWWSGPRMIKGILSITPFVIFPEAPNYPFSCSLIHKLLGKVNHFFAYKVVERNAFSEADSIIMDSIFQPFWSDYLTYKKLIFRVCDNYKGFPNVGERTIRVYEALLEKADVIACSSNLLFNEMKSRFSVKTKYLPNGVDISRFQESRNAVTTCTEVSCLRVVYVGTYEDWFDFELVESLIQRLSHITFCFIGTVTKPLRKFGKYENVELVGPVAAELLPSMLRRCDVGIIPFDVKSHETLLNYVNPLKLYEYFACGLPVVSTYWEEMALLKSPAMLCQTVDEFCEAIQKAFDSQSIDSRELMAFAERNDWKSTVKEFYQNVL